MIDNDTEELMMANALAGDELARMFCIQRELMMGKLSPICLSWLEEMAEDDDAYAQTYYCEYMLDNTPPNCDWKKVERYCKSLREEDPGTAYRLLGEMHLVEDGRVYDAAKAEKCLQKAVELGDTDACELLACKWKDEGHDPAEIRTLLEKIPSEHRSDCVWSLLTEVSIQAGDDEATLKYARLRLRKNPEATSAMLLIAYYYATGTVVRMNKETALKYYWKAANCGNALGMYYVGMMHYAGEGCRRNFSRAVDFLRRALEAGYTAASSSLATCYILGQGVQANVSKGVEILMDGAQDGDANCCEQLASLYAKGSDEERNLPLAYKYILLAEKFAEGDMLLDVDGINKLKQSIERDLTDEQKAEVLQDFYQKMSDMEC